MYYSIRTKTSTVVLTIDEQKEMLKDTFTILQDFLRGRKFTVIERWKKTYFRDDLKKLKKHLLDPFTFGAFTYIILDDIRKEKLKGKLKAGEYIEIHENQIMMSTADQKIRDSFLNILHKNNIKERKVNLSSKKRFNIKPTKLGLLGLLLLFIGIVTVSDLLFLLGGITFIISYLRKRRSNNRPSY